MRKINPLLLLSFILLSTQAFASMAVNWPDDWDGINGNPGPISCDESYPEDSYGNPHPDLTGYPSSTSCSDLGITYDDAVSPLCGYNSGSSLIIRSWTLVDWCANQTYFHDQKIKILDTEDPVNSGPSSVTVDTDYGGCLYYLDGDDLGLSITDNCDYDVELNFNPNEGSALPVGYHNVLVQAIDDCTNIENLSITVHVKDNTPPVAIVDNSFNISLTSNGTGYIHKLAIDEGSYDECGSVYFEVRRTQYDNPCELSEEWGDVVHFCCEDIPISPVTVEFKVTDHSGNVNYAWVDVYVEDKLVPNIHCPADIELSCLDDYFSIINNAGVYYQDLPTHVKNTLGKPTYSSGCSANVYYQVNSYINQCENSTLDITWIVQSDGGQSNGCSQEVHIVREQQNVLNCDDIYFPAGSPEAIAWGVRPWCTVNDNFNDPDDDLPAVQIYDCGDVYIGAPMIDNNSLCTSIGISQSVDTFEFANGVCKKILSHWEVIDFCVFESNYVDPITGEIDPFNSGNGYFEFYAEYDVFDTEGPTVTCTAEYIVDCTESFAGPIVADATDNCSAAGSFGWSWKYDEDNDGTIDYEGAGSSLTASMINKTKFPLGEHKVIWNVNDGCGNNTNESCVFTIIEVDDKPPTPYCHLGLSTSVSEPDLEVVIWAQDFDQGSFDNCSSSDDLLISFSEDPLDNYKTFDCNTLGLNFITMWVTDEAGNQDFCSTFLTVFDNGSCNNVSTIAGRVRSEVGVPVSGATVTLDGPDGTMETISDEEGNYSFESHWYQNMELTASHSGEPLNGVNSVDLVYMHRHIIGSEPFESPYQIIASDVNASEAISVYDVVELRRLILGHYEDFPDNKPWHFVHADYDFPDGDAMNFEEKIYLDQVVTSLDFIAIKTGDANNSFLGYNFNSAEVREAVEIDVQVEESTDIISYDFVLTSDLEMDAFQMEMKINEEINESAIITSDLVGFGLQNYYQRGNLISIAYHLNESSDFEKGQSLFRIETVKLGVEPELSIYKDRIKSEVYRSGESKKIVLREIPVSVSLDLSEFSPNPFTNHTRIQLESDRDQLAKITVLDVQGKQIHSRQLPIRKGVNEVQLSEEIFNLSGLYFVNLEYGEKITQKKVIFLGG